jgi:hypothetical protein
VRTGSSTSIAAILNYLQGTVFPFQQKQRQKTFGRGSGSNEGRDDDDVVRPKKASARRQREHSHGPHWNHCDCYLAVHRNELGLDTMLSILPDTSVCGILSTYVAYYHLTPDGTPTESSLVHCRRGRLNLPNRCVTSKWLEITTYARSYSISVAKNTPKKLSIFEDRPVTQEVITNLKSTLSTAHVGQIIPFIDEKLIVKVNWSLISGDC